MARTTIWVHGVTVGPRNPSSFPVLDPAAGIHYVDRTSAGSKFSPQLAGNQEFHVAIPTPVLLNEYFMQLSSVTVLYEAADATIGSVAIYDGQRLIEDVAVAWTGLHDVFDASNRVRLPAPADLSAGVVVVFNVRFEYARGGANPAGSVRFLAIGADFEPGETWLGRLIRILLQWFRPNP